MVWSVMYLTPSLYTDDLSLSVVHGLSNHRQRSGSSAAKCCSDPRDGAAVERPAAQSSSPELSVHGCPPTTDGSDLQEVSGLSTHTRHGDQTTVHDLQGKASFTS